MHKDFPQRGDKVTTMHNVQQDVTIEDMGRNVRRIYIALDNNQTKFYSHMIEVEGKINDQPIVVLIDSVASHNYLDLKTVERFHFPRRNLGKPWLVQLATGAKRRINEMVKSCPMEMNGMCTKVYLNIIPFGSCDCLISMDWFDEHHVVLDCYNKAFYFPNEQGNLRSVQGITRSLTIIETPASHLKKSYRKGCQVFTAHMEEASKDKVPSVGECVVMKEYEDVFKEISGFPLKRDIDFSINLMLGVAPISKTPYKMSMLELKELQMQLEELMKKEYIRTSVSPWGVSVLFMNKKDGTVRLSINF
jgi:hypothetical protein